MTNDHVSILQQEILLAEEKMKYSIAMRPIVVYMQKRVDELIAQGETDDKNQN